MDDQLDKGGLGYGDMAGMIPWSKGWVHHSVLYLFLPLEKTFSFLDSAAYIS